MFVPTIIVETAVPTRVVGTTAREIIVGTFVPTIIALTACYLKFCIPDNGTNRILAKFGPVFKKEHFSSSKIDENRPFFIKRESHLFFSECNSDNTEF